MARASRTGICLPFITDTNGSVLPLFAVLAVPVLAGVGAAVDYSRAAAVRTQLQAQLDSALLAGAKDASNQWTQVALNVFNGSPHTDGATVNTPTFSVDANGNYQATVIASVPTSILGAVAIPSVAVAAT